MLKYTTKRLLIKLLLLSTVFYTISISLQSILQKPSIKQYNQQLHLLLNHKFNQYYYNILSSTFNLDSNPKFIQKLQQTKQYKLENDNENNQIWYLTNEEDINYPLDVEWHKPSVESNIQPFDPRLTLSVYYTYLQTHYNNVENIPFHWSDWVDLSILDKYILNPNKEDLCTSLFNVSSNQDTTKNSNNVKPIEDYCRFDPQSLLGYEIFNTTGQQTLSNRELLGKSYLFSSAPSPRKLVFLTNNSPYEIQIKHSNLNNLQYSILHNGMITESHYNVVKNYQSLIETNPPPINHKTSPHIIHIPEESFNSNTTTLIQTLSSSNSITDEAFIDSITFSNNCQDPPKYFEEAKLLSSEGNSWQGEHYDWRFFSGLITDKNHQNIILHRLIKNYLSLTRQNGILTWLAHGSLLSWYWNGITFPWDNDIDVQMPIQDLYKLARDFNQSLIVESAALKIGDTYKFDGMGRYFLDIGSTITNRRKNNGNNAIDGRFIDIDTGLYIDITGLALTDEPASSRYDPQYEIIENKSIKTLMKTEMNHLEKNFKLKVYNCRNNHFVSHSEISPLVSSVVENHLGFIPSNFITLLNNEYNLQSLTKKNHRDYTFFNNFRLWFNTEIVMDYLSDSPNWEKVHKHKILKDTSIKIPSNLDLLKLNKLSFDDHLNLIESQGLLLEFAKTSEFTKYHQSELRQFLNMNFDKIQSMIENYTDLGKPMRNDLFMDRVFRNELELKDYQVRFDKLIELMKEYQHEE